MSDVSSSSSCCRHRHLRGGKSDTFSYLQAVQNGAMAIVAERPIVVPQDIPVVYVYSSRQVGSTLVSDGIASTHRAQQASNSKGSRVLVDKEPVPIC